jgi:hypothetical protein
MTDHVGVAFGDSTHVARRRKIRSDHADRHAGPAPFAGGPVRNGLTTAESAVGEKIVEFAGAFPDQVCKHLAFFLAVQVGAGRGRRQVELRCIARVLGH